jgi:hypothetical protein
MAAAAIEIPIRSRYSRKNHISDAEATSAAERHPTIAKPMVTTTRKNVGPRFPRTSSSS